MNSIHRSGLWLSLVAITLSACGGGGGGAAAPVSSTLVSIALSPLTASLAPGGSAQLTVTGTYSDSAVQSLTSGVTFVSSDTTTATVSATGLVTVAAGAAVGATTTITATDTASGEKTSASTSTLVTVVAAGAGPPTPTSISAAQSTAANTANCNLISPFYWEIGDKSGALASGSIGIDSSTGNPVTATSNVSIASASKWIYGMYVVQKRGGVANLTAQDINFLHFTSGYTYMGSDTTTSTCPPPASGPDSIDACLTLVNSSGEPFDAQNPATEGIFYYDSGHEENHAGQFQPEIATLDTADLGPAIVTELLGPNSSVSLKYEQPLLAGGIYGNAASYTTVLRAVLSGQLGMLDALGTSPVCAWVGAGCNAAFSPVFTTHWHYSIAHWVEDEPTIGDGAFSSPGAFGFYPWIEANKLYYGVISRYSPTGDGLQNGVASAMFGYQIRAAWDSGIAP